MNNGISEHAASQGSSLPNLRPKSALAFGYSTYINKPTKSDIKGITHFYEPLLQIKIEIINEDTNS
jgi:hypothetical protein